MVDWSTQLLPAKPLGKNGYMNVCKTIIILSLPYTKNACKFHIWAT